MNFTPHADGGGGATPEPRRPAPLKSRPLGEALDLVVREAIRAHIVADHKNTPELLTSQVVLDWLWPSTAKDGVCNYAKAPSSVVVSAVTPPQGVGPGKHRGLVATVLSSLSEFWVGPSPTTRSKQSKKPESPFDFSVVDLNKLVIELDKVSKKIDPDPSRFLLATVQELPFQTIGNQLSSESELPTLSCVATYLAFCRTIRGLACSAGSGMWVGRTSAGSVLQLTASPKPFLEFCDRFYTALEKAVPEIRNVCVMDAEDLGRLVGTEYIGKRPKALKLLCLPIRYGEISYGSIVMPLIPTALFEEFPPELQKDLEWLGLKAGEAAHLLMARNAATTSLSIQDLSITPPDVRVIRPQEKFEAGGAVCRRVILRVNDEVAVVFISDDQAEGRSITNQVLALAQKSLPDITEVPLQKIRWYERRTGGRTGSGVPQSRCFDEVRIDFAEHTVRGWRPARGSLATQVSEMLGFSLTEQFEQ